MAHSALIVDDDRDELLQLADVFRREGFAVETSDDLSAARNLLLKRMPEVAMLKEHIDGQSTLDVLNDLELSELMEVYLLSNERTLESALQAMRLGVSDYFELPVDEDMLVDRLRQLKDELSCELVDDPDQTNEGERMIGDSPVMQKLFRKIRKCARSDATVLIIGESGTGKELAMQRVHDLSERSHCPLITVNCSAIAKDLMESEIFGHVKGSFTGAASDHKGFFERAVGGTLFLDEITEMDAGLQAKLLRVLESGKIRRVGDEKDIAIDVRIIAATNRDPAEALNEGSLRQDLYYRLAQFPLQIPPLRLRGDDIEQLSAHFLAQQSEESGIDKSLSEDVVEAFRLYEWPGNVRELKNAVIHGYLVSGSRIEMDDLPEQLAAVLRGDGPVSTGAGAKIADVERKHILATLDYCEGNKKKAAEKLGISLKTLYNRLHEYYDQ